MNLTEKEPIFKMDSPYYVNNFLQALDALNTIMNYSEHFLVGMKNFTGEDQPFTEVEFSTLESLINDTKVSSLSICKQAKLKPTQWAPYTTLSYPTWNDSNLSDFLVIFFRYQK